MKRTALLLSLIAVAPALFAQGMPPAAVELDAVRRETVRDEVTGVATVEPWLRTVLAAEISGQVESYPLREGEEVVAGETVVCGLDRTTLEIDRAEAEALLSRAKAEAATAVQTARATMEELRALKDRADRDFARSRELFAREVINRSEMDRAEADAVAAGFQFERARQNFDLAAKGADPASQALLAEVRRAEAQLERAVDQLSKTGITSPVNGRVVKRLTEVGGWVAPGAPVIEIVTLDPVLVRVGVNERDIAKVAIGQEARVTTDAHPGRTFAGKVRFIVPEADRASRSFPVLVEVANADLALKAGMFARVAILAGGGQQSLTVPKDAVVKSSTGEVVWTIRSTGPEAPPIARPVPVTTGRFAAGRVEVTGEGLTEGMPVIVTGNETLFPGRPVIPSGGGGPGGGGPGGGGHPGGGAPGGGQPGDGEGGGDGR